MIDKKPLITIFTPNFNNSKYISEAIESIIKQNYNHFEYLIIDDCSSDNSWEIIQNYALKDKRIKTIRNERNLGIVKTRNKGFLNRAPKSKYFAILDSDDISLPNRLKIQVEFLEKNNDYGLVGSDAFIIDENSKIIGFRGYPSGDNEIRKKFMRYNPFTQSSIILRTEIINQIGLYDENLHVCQDYDYWLRIGISWKLANINKPLIKYRISKTQVKFTNIEETILNTYIVQNKAIESYGYQDNLVNRLFRILLKSLLVLPKIAYYLYRIRLKLKWFN